MAGKKTFVKEVRKMAEGMEAAKESAELTVRFNLPVRRTLKEALTEIWEIREEHPDIKINVEVSC